MLEAIKYKDMLDDLQKSKCKKNTIGILLTRSDLAAGMSIVSSLPYYHHRSGESINFYLPGFGVY